MRARHCLLALGLGAAASQVPAQGIPSGFPEQEVLVIVWRAADQCSVLERRTHCSRVARLMQGPLQIGRDRTILVAVESGEPPMRTRASQVITDIKAAGYRHVRPAGTHQ